MVSDSVLFSPPKRSVLFSSASVAYFPILSFGYFPISSTAVSLSTDNFDFTSTSFQKLILLPQFRGSVFVARGFAEASPHHFIKAAKNTGGCPAHKPFANNRAVQWKRTCKKVNFH
jgi:hypothetical protein